MRESIERLTGLMVGTYHPPTTWNGGPTPWFAVGPTWKTEARKMHRNGLSVVVGRFGFYVAREPRPTDYEYVGAEYKGYQRLLGEDEHGFILVPSKTRAEWWDRRFNPRNPTHWPYWLRSRLARRIVFLETS